MGLHAQTSKLAPTRSFNAHVQISNFNKNLFGEISITQPDYWGMCMSHLIFMNAF